MEQQRYWMWTKRRSSHGLMSSHHVQASTTYDDSWEEQAFAEDAAAGSLGGCIWPPRSYSCSFCGREFRSAQALGGHMNVHRRDRARLKQSPTSQEDQIHHQNPFLPVGNNFQLYQSDHHHHDEVCNFVCKPNPNSNNNDHATLPSPPSSAPPTKENCPDEETFVPPFSSPIVLDNIPIPNSKPKSSWSNLAAHRYYHFSDLRTQGEKSPRILESTGCRVKEDYVQTHDLSVSLNLVVRRTRPATSGGSEEETTTVGCKRKRSDHTHTPTILPFFLDPISIERHHHLQPADHELKPASSVEDDIDLELRLGEHPKVK